MNPPQDVDPQDIDDVSLLALDLLERERVPYAIMGGLAVNIWGIPRTTFDVDLEVDIPRERLPALLTVAEAAGFFFDDAYARGFTEKVGDQHPLVVLKRWVGGQAIHVDLFLAETPFLRRVFDRAVSLDLAGRTRRVVTAADLVLLKLLAWRRKDQADIVNVLAIQGVPEGDYLRREAARLGVLGRWQEILREHSGSDDAPP